MNEIRIEHVAYGSRQIGGSVNKKCNLSNSTPAVKYFISAVKSKIFL